MADRNNFKFARSMLKLKEILWPHVTFYNKQIEIVRSVDENDETFVVAGNELGKDFIAGFICLAFFLTRNPVRIVTTSATDDHLRVLWGEIGRFIDSSKHPLTADKGGPLIVNHQDIRKVYTNGPLKGQRDKISYIQGKVAAPDKIAAMQGHHATPDDLEKANDGVPRTLFVSDESSSVPDGYYPMALTWAKRVFVFGNPWPCENFFKHAIKGKPDRSDPGGDRPRNKEDLSKGFYRKVIQIKAADSPNVRYGMAQQAKRIEPTNELIVPGVKTYANYIKDRATRDKVWQCTALDAEFYEGSDVMMFPKAWLDRAAQIAFRLDKELAGKRQAKAIGIDPAEGGDKTAMVAIDEYGIVDLVSKKTPDTSVITGEAIAFMHKHNVPAEKVAFDRGGGGKQHADVLRAQGYMVRTVAFGETITLDPKRGLTLVEEKKETKEERYAYKNRRSEMYGVMRLLLDPSNEGWGIPAKYVDIFQQLGPIPLTYDGEGRLYLLPKNKKTPDSKEMTLTQLIGHSPDEADALALAIYSMRTKSSRIEAGGY